MSHFTFSVLLIPEPEGGYAVEVPALPGCVTQGETVDDALSMARNAIKMWVEDLIADGDTVPVETTAPRLLPVTVDVPAPVGASLSPSNEEQPRPCRTSSGRRRAP